ncbi:MAG: hypothetical protein ACRC6O_00160 [Flavobacterium sp.]
MVFLYKQGKFQHHFSISAMIVACYYHNGVRTAFASGFAGKDRKKLDEITLDFG